ncbi:YneF family protein [Lactobacillus sp. PV037]|uniref:YneF family protein n=1 Tax=unclassified Lactobacillus TaxID=2620435 RepID=UPI00223F3DA2|nr:MULTISPECIES: YneF family protein [unclassified Lactobacillus]QNQ82116.1 YneF family protein [Lactobacillus sp. PV012]QNQ83850.1 YneF family protein [Lactobacillus sp. PV037]
MNLALAIFLIILALIVGLVVGFFGARSYMKKYFEDNPPISEDMIAAMMAQMGQKPSTKKLNQVMNMMKQKQKRSK